MTADSNLKKQLRLYKNQLANLSRRNRELYYKESKSTSLNLSKLPISISSLQNNCKKNFKGLTFKSEEFENLISGSDLNLYDYLLMSYYQDNVTTQQISNRLDRIRLADDKFQREYGISGAWILGPFLCWRNSMNSQKEDLLITPLFKVAIDLYKNKKKQLILKCEMDSLALNPSFRLAMNYSFGIEFPEDHLFESTSKAIESVISVLEKHEKKVTIFNNDSLPKIPTRFKNIRDEDGLIIERVPIKIEDVLDSTDLTIYNQTSGSEFILLDVLYIDQLNVSRAVLINDYDGIIENGHYNPILNELFNGVTKNIETPPDRNNLRILDSYREKSNYFVVDIDSTQHRAIDKANKSNAIVIQGPPGTGKSQTIVNLIADNLSKGKKVLFVSEKRQALDVVYNRMKSANIEGQSILIHGNNLNRSGLYKSFLEQANISSSSEDENSWKEAAENLDRIKDEINGYADTLREVHKESELKIPELLLQYAIIEKDIYIPEVARQFSKMTFNKIEIFSNYLSEIQNKLQICNNFKSSPWLSKRHQTFATAELKHILENIYLNIKENNEAIEHALEEINGIDILITPLSLENFIPPSFPDLSFRINTISGAFKSSDFQVDSIYDLVNQFKSTLLIFEENKNLASDVNNELDPEIAQQLEEYYRNPRGIFDFFTSQFWALRKIRKNFCPKWNRTNSQFKAYVTYNKALEKLKILNQKITDNYNEESYNEEVFINNCKLQISTITNFLNYINSIKTFVKYDVLEKCLKSKEESEKTFMDIRKIESHLNTIAVTKQKISQTEIKLTPYIDTIPKSHDFKSLENFVKLLLLRFNDLKVFTDIDLIISKAEHQLGENELRIKIEKHFFDLDSSWKDALMKSILQFWHDEIIQLYPHLRSFERLKMDSIQQEFKKSVENHKINSRLAITEVFATNWNSPKANKSGLSLLTKESTKQRRVLSPREVMERGALETMLQLKSCWLMSPLSISQILPLNTGLFDVIIFDEASQVRCADAIPSIYRAKTMIVVGDDKQMPPTTFFSSGSTDDDDEFEEIAPSVLELASLVYPSVLLEWHYRSRSEELIAFSNRAFYGGRLIAAPNPKTLSTSGAIVFHRIESGFFNNKEGNRTEAEFVINELINQIECDPNQSYGIIAMGVSQVSALQEALEKKMNSDVKIAEIIESAIQYKEGDADAGFFIKNLENVQGDERDVILLSVGYAPLSAEKKLRLGFGPLSMKGGGRRLNVAISRAKSKMHVFCSFNPSDIPTDEEYFSKNPDACYFGRYLKYAEAISNGNSELANRILDSFPNSGVITSRKSSRFALDVKKRLEEIGYEVSSEIGTSGFYIDLAIHHPVLKSSFLVGIECDGAIFHSTPYARDRDKIRQSLLESRGWKILRVWSQDWSNDWRSEILRLDQAIKELKNAT